MLMRVTGLVSHLWAHDEDRFREWCDEMNEKHPRKRPLTPERIKKWSSAFGTKMHKWCLEGKAPKRPTKMMIACHNLWVDFLDEKKIKIIRTERKVMYENLYHGTLDAIVEMDGLIVLLDLKFWACWYWVFMKKEIPESRGMTSVKLAKTNFQTYCYQEGQHDEKIDARAVVAICPDKLQFKVFTRSPRDKFQEAIDWLRSQKKADF